MRFVYVLEDDSKFMKEISEALLAVDPKIQIRQFNSLQAFVDWIKILVGTDASAILKGGQVPAGVTLEPLAEGEAPVLQLVVSKIEFLGARQLGLLKKTRELFIRMKCCSAEDPTAFVLTAFEDPNFHISELKDRILSNIMLKPFDRLILQQHLTFALEGRHPPSKHAVAPYKTTAVIEVLKTIEMISLSAVGFETRSNRPLPPGAVAKYYGTPFLSDRHRSVIARLHACEPDPKHPGEFITSFLCFGADQTQIGNLQRKVLSSRDKTVNGVFSIKPSGTRTNCRIFFIDDRDDLVTNLSSTLQRKIQGAEIIRYRNLKEFLLELDPKLEQEKPVKALGDAAFAVFDMTVKGRITAVEGAPVKFNEYVLNVNVNLEVLLRDTEKTAFEAWVAKPQGSFLSLWNWQGRSNVMKLTHVKDRQFRLEEAQAAERDSFMKKGSQVAKGWDFLFVSHRFSGAERLALWKDVPQKAKALGGQGLYRMFMTAATEFSDQEEREMAHVFDDLFFHPVDRIYVLKKMMLMCSDMKVLEDAVEIPMVPFNENLKSARPAEIEELSEAGLVMKYDRAMSLGSFREFVLWQPYEIGAPEINATCNFSEETANKGEWRLHFVFFAMKDVLLKAIRQWIKDNYIHSKDKG